MQQFGELLLPPVHTLVATIIFAKDKNANESRHSGKNQKEGCVTALFFSLEINTFFGYLVEQQAFVCLDLITNLPAGQVDF